MTDAERIARAKARVGRAVLHKTTLSAQEMDLSPIDGPDAISLVTQLSKESFSLTGQPEPRYTRASIPCRFVPGRLT